MIILAKFAVENGWVTGFNNQDAQVGVTSIDITLDRIYRVFKHNSFHVSEKGMQVRGSSEVVPIPSRSGGDDFWKLEPGNWLISSSTLRLELPSDVAVSISTLPEIAQNGVVILDQMLPSGFYGQLQFTLQNACGVTFITPGTSVGRLTFHEVSARYPSTGVFA